MSEFREEKTCYNPVRPASNVIHKIVLNQQIQRQFWPHFLDYEWSRGNDYTPFPASKQSTLIKNRIQWNAKKMAITTGITTKPYQKFWHVYLAAAQHDHVM